VNGDSGDYARLACYCQSQLGPSASSITNFFQTREIHRAQQIHRKICFSATSKTESPRGSPERQNRCHAKAEKMKSRKKIKKVLTRFCQIEGHELASD
jgi:hypothetical protein